jgi:RimJ/RimL family protein N-acetyltransferase
VALHTDRLVLRHWRDEDREPFALLNDDPAAMEFYPARLTRAESDDFVDRMQARLDADGFGLWAVEVREPGGFIGYVGLAPVPFDAAFTPAVEVGWRLAHAAWGHGYATEAARAALDHGFRVVGLDKIVSFTTPANLRSQRVMQKLGMSCDPADDFDHPNVPDGDPLRRHVLYRLSRSSFACP